MLHEVLADVVSILYLRCGRRRRVARRLQGACFNSLFEMRDK